MRAVWAVRVSLRFFRVLPRLLDCRVIKRQGSAQTPTCKQSIYWREGETTMWPLDLPDAKYSTA
jgi:hypothetical protein